MEFGPITAHGPASLSDLIGCLAGWREENWGHPVLIGPGAPWVCSFHYSENDSSVDASVDGIVLARPWDAARDLGMWIVAFLA